MMAPLHHRIVKYRKLLGEVLRHLLQPPLACFQARRIGDSVVHVRELGNIRNVLTDNALTLVPDLRVLRQTIARDADKKMRPAPGMGGMVEARHSTLLTSALDQIARQHALVRAVREFQINANKAST